jgi:uncharacterized protein (DUF1499 family)
MILSDEGSSFRICGRDRDTGRGATVNAAKGRLHASRHVFAGLIAFVVLVLAAGQLHLLDTIYERLFGSPDLGPVAFGTVTRRTSGNDALACPPGICGSAKVDIRPPNYGQTAEMLRRSVRRYFASQGAVLVASDDAWLHDRFVMRTLLLRFPDTVDVEIVPTDANHASLAVYSRSQIGRFDLGTNLRRLRALLEALGPGVASATLEYRRGLVRQGAKTPCRTLADISKA